MNQVFKEKDVCVINSLTSVNNGKTVEVIGYCKGKCEDIVRVILTTGGNPFNIKESSLKLANHYDIIRNMNDNELDEIIKKKVRKKLQKKFNK